MSDLTDEQLRDRARVMRCLAREAQREAAACQRAELAARRELKRRRREARAPMDDRRDG